MKIHTLISMGDVLPPKRQTVVERLKRRLTHYRQHQNACLPRYEQAANGLYETQRQDTLLLKQRYLESKAKKAKSKADHHRAYKEPSSDGAKSQLHSKSLKRNADEALSNATPDPSSTHEDTEKPAKIQCTEPAQDHKPSIKTDIPLQQSNQQTPLSSFSVQIVQQFSQPQTAQQTIQTNVTVQALPKAMQSPVPATNVPELSGSTNLDTQLPATLIECKQEKDTDDNSDLCQFKTANPTSNHSVGSGDRLSDTFPSIEFTDESGEAVLHPDILNDLIEDVFTNSADIMKDFNFEDSVGSLKDQEEATKDIIDSLKSSSPALGRTFHADGGLNFGAAASGNGQQNGLFKNIPSSNDTSGPTITSNTTASVTSSSTSYYNSAPQRIQSYNNSSLPLPNGMNLDFKMSEPSPAALTLKQLAEQHQNMQQKQQQQLGNTPLSSRPQAFNQNNFASHMRPSNYINGSNPASVQQQQQQNNSPKLLNTGSPMFNAFDQRMNSFQQQQAPEQSPNFPASNCDTMNSPNSMFGGSSQSAESAEVRALRMKLQQQQKPPAYANPQQPMTMYAGNPSPGQQPQHRPIGRQFQNNPGMRLQMAQQIQQPSNAQQMPQESHDLKQQQQQHAMMQQQPHMFNNYPPQQQPSNQPFHVPMSQSMQYSPQQYSGNSGINRPPPEYKATHQRNSVADNMHIVEQLNAPSQVMFNQQPPKGKYAKQQRPPNVTITPDGNAVSASHDWRTNLMGNQQQQQQQQFRGGPGSFNPQDNFDDVPLSPIYSQFRMPGNQIPTRVRPNTMQLPPNHMLYQQQQQRHRLNIPQQQPMRNVQQPSMEHVSMGMVNNPMNTGSMMGPMYSEHQDMDRQDGSHLSLDFLDNIESSASDLLNFDQVMQGGAHYPNLDDILGK